MRIILTILCFLLTTNVYAREISSPPPLKESPVALQHYLEEIYQGVHTFDVVAAKPTSTPSEGFTKMFDSSSTYKLYSYLNDGWRRIDFMDGSITIGSGGTGVDYSITFDGEDNNGVITWKEDEDYFESSDKWLFLDKISFTQTDENEYIDSLTDGELDLEATTSINFRINTTEQIQILDGILQPITSNDIDIGTSSLLIKDIWQIGKHQLRDSAIGIYSQADTFMDLFADGAVRIGDSSAGAPTNYVEIESDGDVNFVAGAGLQFGEIFAHDNAVETDFGGSGVGNKSQITIFTTDGVSNGDVTPSNSQDHITLGKAGMYFVSISIAASTSAGGSDEYGFSLWKNNGDTEFANVHSHRIFGGGGGDFGSISMSGIIDGTASDTLEVWVWNEDNTESILIDDITLSAMQIGGT